MLSLIKLMFYIKPWVEIYFFKLKQSLVVFKPLGAGTVSQLSENVVVLLNWQLKLQIF